jgi:hypothetical protein
VREERRKNVEKAKLRATFVSGRKGVADLGVKDSDEV